MPRNDTHLDAMLRHLGAAYYESLYGRATRADVSRAVDTVAEHLNEQAQPHGPATRDGARHTGKAGHGADGTLPGQPRGWARRVHDVMTTSVVTVDRATSYKEIARLIAEHRVSGLPVLKMGREVVGVVTEADLLAAEDRTRRRLRDGHRWRPRPADLRAPAFTAGALMTEPAITIGPNATVPAAARLMSSRHIRLLPVVDSRGKLLGVVSRRDLLTVFLRPDQDIAADIRRVLDEILDAEPEEAEVTVRDGIVTLTGTLDRKTGPHGDLIPVSIRLMWDVDGVVDVIDRLGQPRSAPNPEPAPDELAGHET